MNERTPGPWTVVPGIYDTNPETACEFPHGPEVVHGKTTVAFCQMYGEADARLIAAAPDMLEALNAILANAMEDEREPRYGVEQAAIEVARKAIAKAEGRP